MLKFFTKIETEGEPLNSFYKPGLTLIPNPSKDTSKKGNNTLIPLMHIDTNILKKILANHIEGHIRRIITMINLALFQRGRNNLIHESINDINHTNGLKDKNQMVISIGTK